MIILSEKMVQKEQIPEEPSAVLRRYFHITDWGSYYLAFVATNPGF